MLKIMGEHIKNIGALTQSDIQHLKTMRRTGADIRKIKKILAEMTAKNVSDIEKIFDTLARNGYTDAKTAYELKHEPFIPFSENTALQSFINSVSRQAIADYMNLSRTTAAKMLKADGTVVNMPFDKAYDSIIDEAVHNITTGAQNPQKAMRNALKTFAEGGIRTVEYESGHTRRLDSAVRANILEGMRKVNQGVQDILGEQLGTDIVEISVHQFPAPDHEDIQGKQMSNEEYAKWDKAHEYPLRQIGKLNCRHVVFHKFSGQSPEYTPEQLEEIKRRNHAKITFMEKEYTVYEATQLQRKIETETRKQKHVQVLARSCGDRELAETAQRKINELTKRYKELSEKSGLSVQKDRMSVSGYRKIKAENLPKALDNSSQSGIINKGDKYYLTADNKLPNSICAVTVQDKLQKYLLNSNHPVGKHKAKVINSVLGYNYENWNELSDKIFDGLQTTAINKQTNTEYGTKYIVPIRINGKKNKSMVLNTVWQIDTDSNIPRFITSTFDKRTIKNTE